MKKKDPVLSIVVIGVLSGVLALVLSNASIFIASLVSYSVLVLISKGEIKQLFPVFLIQYTFLLITYFGYLSKYGSPYYLGGSDDLDFENLAIQCIDENIFTFSKASKVFPIMFSDGKTFVLLLSYLMRITNVFGGYHTLVGRLVNIFLLDLIAIMMQRSMLNERSQPKYNTVFLLIALFPSCIYISVHAFRDVLSAFILVSVYFLLQGIRKRRSNILMQLLRVLLIVILAYLAYFNRKMNLLYLGLLLLIWLVNVLSTGKNRYLVLAVLVILAFPALGYIGFFDTIEEYTSFYSDYIVAKNTGFASYVFSLPLWPSGFIMRVIYGIIFPSPAGIFRFPDAFFDIDSFWTFINAFGTVAQCFFFALLLSKLKAFDDFRVISIFIFLSIIVTTFGFRHFIYFYPFFFRGVFSNTGNKTIVTKDFPSRKTSFFGGTV